MKPSKKYLIYIFFIFILFTLFINFAGFFKIGLLSDDYLNFYDAVHSSPGEKFTGTLPFTNPLHFRPLYYLSLQISSYFHDSLGFAYDNFIFYKIQNLVLYFIILFLTGWIVLASTGKTSYAVFSSLIIMLFPNNIHNICWTAGRVDLLCCAFYLGALYFSLLYYNKKSGLTYLLSVLSFILALMSKETALTLPFALPVFFSFTGGIKKLKENLLLLITLGGILIIYLIYRLIFLNTGYTKYYEDDYLSLLLKSIISLTIPFDYLDLKLLLLDGNLLTMAFVVITAAVIIWYITMFILNDAYKPVIYLIILSVILLAPYLYIDYIRPQMILIPFTITVIFLAVSLDWLQKYFGKINVRLFSAVLIILILFFSFYSFRTIIEWEAAYNKALPMMESLLKTNIEPNKNTVIVGNAGRLKQSFMFDKLTGAYGYWKYKSFTIKDTINDIVQTGALDAESLNSKLNYRLVNPGEYEISATGRTQFFYMEGFNDDKGGWKFANKDMSVEAIAYNFLNKPNVIRLRILSPDVNCYLASEMKYYKIN